LGKDTRQSKRQIQRRERIKTTNNGGARGAIGEASNQKRKRGGRMPGEKTTESTSNRLGHNRGDCRNQIARPNAENWLTLEDKTKGAYEVLEVLKPA